MKTNSIKGTILVLFLLVSRQAGMSQGFENLDFESAQIIPIVNGFAGIYSIATTNALPDWAVFIGNSQISQITYNAPAAGSTWVFLDATNGEQISGNFSVSLQGGGSAPYASISQTGLVPAGTESIQFEAQPSLAAVAGSLTVALGGQTIPIFNLSGDLYGGNISAFAGQTEQLTISALEGVANNWTIDNIQFSPLAVPEPSVLAVGALGAVLLGLGRKIG